MILNSIASQTGPTAPKLKAMLWDIVRKHTFPMEDRIRKLFDTETEFLDTKAKILGERLGSDNSCVWRMTQFAANKQPAKWSKLLLSLGIKGCVDHAVKGGQATIHSNEPNQAVFFTQSVLTPLEVIKNKYAMQPQSGERKSGDHSQFPGLTHARFFPNYNDPVAFAKIYHENPDVALKEYDTLMAALPKALHWIHGEFGDQGDLWKELSDARQQSMILLGLGRADVVARYAPVVIKAIQTYLPAIDKAAADGSFDPSDYKLARQLLGVLLKASGKAVP